MAEGACQGACPDSWLASLLGVSNSGAGRKLAGLQLKRGMEAAATAAAAARSSWPRPPPGCVALLSSDPKRRRAAEVEVQRLQGGVGHQGASSGAGRLTACLGAHRPRPRLPLPRPKLTACQWGWGPRLCCCFACAAPSGVGCAYWRGRGLPASSGRKGRGREAKNERGTAGASDLGPRRLEGANVGGRRHNRPSMRRHGAQDSLRLVFTGFVASGILIGNARRGRARWRAAAAVGGDGGRSSLGAAHAILFLLCLLLVKRTSC